MKNINPRKFAGYTLIVGPIIALLSFFIQPGGVLQIGGSVDPTNTKEVLQLLNDYSELAIISSITVVIGLVTLLSGLIYYSQSMEGGEGYAVSRTGIPFIFIAISGWCLASSIGIGAASGVIDQEIGPKMTFSINIISTILFGFGSFFITWAATMKKEYNRKVSLWATAASIVVFFIEFIVPFAPDLTTLVNTVTGTCFMIITVWAISIGRTMIK
ncbi:MAG: hypothetical protein CL773_02230 [Chloroflexi bacterium]|nr:hypothetical protein [Chloroflexota bacterium]|tara:strand:+ start:1565 stop:2209 length:645 start_codon:yes stop_codon:yes gene_type:complete